MSAVSSTSPLSAPPERIRNICVLAHVDHGKTSLTDSLIAANGIISKRLAGSLRYMDSREDEQMRGITMKSSAIALSHRYHGKDPYLVHLIDSPGHVDFTGEVESALLVCDGAIIVVDVIEGVCAQTVSVLRAALDQELRPVLVLNKVDRLFYELQLTPQEAYQRLFAVVGQVNVILGERDRHLWLQKNVDDDAHTNTANPTDDEPSQWKIDNAASNKDHDDDDFIFAPEKGNVVFASAHDGWAFRVNQFADIYYRKFGIKRDVLQKCLWGNYYIDTKRKRIAYIMSASAFEGTAQTSHKKTMFVQFILDNIWAIYKKMSDPHSSLDEKQAMIDKLNLKVNQRDLLHKDTKVAVRTVMSSWLPLASAVLDTVIEKIQSPVLAQKSRIHTLWPTDRPPSTQLEPYWNTQRQALLQCQNSHDVPVLAYISKMFPMQVESWRSKISFPKGKPDAPPVPQLQQDLADLHLKDAQEQSQAQSPLTLVALARIFSGTITPGSKVYLYGPRYNPMHPLLGQYKHLEITGIHMLMGRDMEPVDCASAGNICGITGLDDAFLKKAILSNLPPGECLPMSKNFGSEKSSTLVVRVAIEAHNPKQMAQLSQGLKRLSQSDPAVETYITRAGEQILAATGELHLERCLKDIREMFAPGIRFHVSKPLISYRETIVGDSIRDIQTLEDLQDLKMHTFSTHNKICKIIIQALPLPGPLAVFLEEQGPVAKAFVENRIKRNDSDVSRETMERIRQGFEEALQHEDMTNNEFWRKLFTNHLWSLGPNRFGPNALFDLQSEDSISREAQQIRMLFSATVKELGEGESEILKESEDQSNSEALKESEDRDDSEIMEQSVQHEEGIDLYHETTRSIISGFQLACSGGPLCEEQLYGVAYIINSITLDSDREISADDPYGPYSGQVISATKEGLKACFLESGARLMEAKLKLEVQASVEALGSLYGLMSKRRGKIYREDLKEGTQIFLIEAVLPLSESFGFAEALRKQTSGEASPQMVFCGWETLQQDPFWTPTTEEELQDLGTEDSTIVNNNLARKLVNKIRRRKGMSVEEKIVENAEKQRNLSRKK